VVTVAMYFAVALASASGRSALRAGLLASSRRSASARAPGQPWTSNIERRTSRVWLAGGSDPCRTPLDVRFCRRLRETTALTSTPGETTKPAQSWLSWPVCRDVSVSAGTPNRRRT